MTTRFPRAGDLDQVIEVQSRASSLNTFGDPSGAWTTFLTTRAQVLPQRGSEQVDANQVRTVPPVRLLTHYTEAITPEHRIICRGRILEIDSVIDRDFRRQALEIECIDAGPSS